MITYDLNRHVGCPAFITVKRSRRFLGRHWVYRYRVFVGDHWQTFHMLNLPFGLSFGFKARKNTDAVPRDEPEELVQLWHDFEAAWANMPPPVV